MFANFELCQKGLVKADPRPRHKRTPNGCLQCKKSKRKCGEERPICNGCSRRGVECSFTYASPFSPSSHSQPGSPQSIATPKARAGSFDSESPSISWSTSRSGSPSTEVASVEESGPTTLFPASVAIELNDVRNITVERESQQKILPLPDLPITVPSFFYTLFSQPEEQRSLESLKTIFHPLVTLSYAHPDRSILANGLPLAFECHAVKAAFVACGLALIFKISGKWEDQALALKYYNQTVHSIARDLIALPVEFSLAAILLLHLFEEISNDMIQRKHIHLKGAQGLISSVFKREEPSSSHMVLLLEAYIYHIVVSDILNSTPPTLPENHVSDLLGTLRTCSERFLPGPLWASGGILGLSHELFDIAFRVSHLRRRLPLRDNDLLKAAELRERLQEWSLPPSCFQAETQQLPPIEMVLTAQLYHLACQLLLAKVVDPELESSHPGVRTMVRDSVSIIEQLPVSQHDAFVLNWPAIVLGSGAILPEERRVFQRLVPKDLNIIKFGYLVAVAKYLENAWTFDDSLGRDLGIDILVRNVL